ncbi:hypothetical protein VPEG_00064 [Vibrio phage SIO-2]|uniref:hypothetical protein n=1 Tax=Vibrio phage SIO-2 TaxID=700512 RepID=UPI0002357C66|nr:hypothetical protein VPEG_00064 [Vibrio phage SIO-2]AET42215.1 hypothetical protein VPEG_00064 [Vibrio phage SIO-2]
MALRLNVPNRNAVYLNHLKVTANVNGDSVRLSYRLKGQDFITEPLRRGDTVTVNGVVIGVDHIKRTQVTRLWFDAHDAIVINGAKIYKQCVDNTGGFVIQRRVYTALFKEHGLDRQKTETLIAEGKPHYDNADENSGELKTNSFTFHFINDIVYEVSNND